MTIATSICPISNRRNHPGTRPMAAESGAWNVAGTAAAPRAGQPANAPAFRHTPAISLPDARLLGALVIAAAFIGAVALVSLPAARAVGAAFGAMPLWLVCLPLASLAALAAARRSDQRVPRRCTPDSSALVHRQRPGTSVQARRRPASTCRTGRARAA